jgi:hypothetical protein
MSEPGTVKIPRDLAGEADRIGSATRQDLAKRVKDMDPPSRAAAAVVMAIEGAGYDDIARVLDYGSPMQARRALWDAIAASGADHDDVEKMRALQSRRLDKLLYSVMRRATKNSDPDQVVYGRLALAILDRQAKLYGLDAETKVVVYTPTQKEIAEYARNVTEALRTAAGVAAEADIIDVEVIEGATDGAASRAS